MSCILSKLTCIERSLLISLAIRSSLVTTAAQIFIALFIRVLLLGWISIIHEKVLDIFRCLYISSIVKLLLLIIWINSTSWPFRRDERVCLCVFNSSNYGFKLSSTIIIILSSVISFISNLLLISMRNRKLWHLFLILLLLLNLLFDSSLASSSHIRCWDIGSAKLANSGNQSSNLLDKSWR